MIVLMNLKKDIVFMHQKEKYMQTQDIYTKNIALNVG